MSGANEVVPPPFLIADILIAHQGPLAVRAVDKLPENIVALSKTVILSKTAVIFLPALLRQLLKIFVSEREKSADGTVRQEIKIYYKFIGFVGELHITPTKRWTALPAKHCTVCDVEYVPGSAISKYCPICAKKVQREKSNESRRRSRTRDRQVCIELSAKNDRLKKTMRSDTSINPIKSRHSAFQ